MIPVTLTDASVYLGHDFEAAGAEQDKQRVLLFLDAAEALVTASSNAATDDSLAKLITLDVVRRAWLGSQVTNPEYASYSKTVGGVTESYSRPSGSSFGGSVFLTDGERAALRGSFSSARARSVALGGVSLRSVLTDEGV